MKTWMAALGQKYSQQFGISLKEEFALCQSGAMPRAQQIRRLQGGLLTLMDKQDVRYANRTLMAHMVELGMWKQDWPEDKERVLLEKPEGLGQRRALVSKRRDIEPSDQTREALEFLQSNTYSVNLKVYEVMKGIGGMPGYLATEVERVLDSGDATFFYDWMVDWRTRLYANAYGALNFQGDHYNRALVRWGKAYKIGDNFTAFASVLLDEYGVTKENYQDIIDNFVSYHKEDGMDFKVLDAAFAMQEVIDTGETSYIVQQDATCSGFQHMACLMGDHDLAQAVNVLGSNAKRNDLYMLIVDTFMKQQGPWQNYLSGISKKKLRKFLAKPTVMLTGYGSTANPIALKFLGYDDKAKFIDENGDLQDCEGDWDLIVRAIDQGQIVTFMPPSFLASFFEGMDPTTMMQHALSLAVMFQETLFKAFPSIFSFLELMKDYAKTTFKENGKERCAIWENPVGTTIYDLPWKCVNSGEVETITYTKDGKKHSCNMLKMFKDAKSAGFPPNFIHSFDAAIIIMVILKAKEAGIPTAPIHDSIGTTVESMHLMPRFYSEAMAETYNDRDWLLDLFGMKLKQNDIKLDATKNMIY